MKIIVNILVFLFYVAFSIIGSATILFILASCYAALVHSTTGWTWLLTFIGVVIVSASLESIQQAANSAKSIPNDVTELKSCNTVSKKLLLLLKSSDLYEKFSSARQFLSIFSILGVKTCLELMVSPTMQWNIMLFSLQVDLASLLKNEILQFAASAMFIAWFLQLFPKRLARRRPVEFFGYFRSLFAYFLLLVGRLGVGFPAQIIAFLYSFIFRQSLSESIYPPSTEAQIDDLARRFGFFAEETKVQIIIGKGSLDPEESVKLLETTRYVVSEMAAARDLKIPALIHRLSLDGKWQLLKTAVDEDHGSRDTKMIHRHEKISNIPETDFIQLDDIDEADIAHTADDLSSADYDDEAVKTSTATHVYFKTPVAVRSPQFTSISVQSLLLEIDSLGGAGGVRDRTFGVSVTVPTKLVTVEIISLSDSTPSASTLELVDLVGSIEADTPEFEPLGTSYLSSIPDAKHGMKTSVRLPVFGSKLEVKTRC